MKNIFNNKGLTLIELLVVISIIGLLSSVVLASLNTAREKARIAAGQTFSTHTYRAIGDQGEGIYDFNEGSGVTSNDATGLGRNILLSGSSLWSTNTYNNKGYSLNFNGTSDWAETPDINMNGTSETVTLWVKTSVGNDVLLIGHSYYRRLLSNYWLFVDSNPAGYPTSYNYINHNVNINDGKWHQIGYSLTGQSVKIYADGKQVNSATLSANMNPFNYKWALGGRLCSGPGCSIYSSELVDDFHIFNKALTSKEIENLYVQEKSSYLLAYDN